MSKRKVAFVEPTPQRIDQLKAYAASLAEQLEAGDHKGAMETIDALSESRDQCLYREVGQLTRKLHESIRDFQIDAQSEGQIEALSKVTDASDRLGYVVEMTGQAANKTMDLVEEAMPKAAEFHTMASELKAQWADFRDEGYSAEEFKGLYQRVADFFDTAEKQAEYTQGALQEILMAQDFQDLTGQVIQKVTTLVKDLESHLLDLVVMASHVDNLAGVEHTFDEKEEQEESSTQGHGPQTNKDGGEDVVSGQDDVDDLLSSLGF